MIKIFESNMKRLNGIIVTYTDKKGKDIESSDIKERNEVIYILKATLQLFKFDYERQTKRFKGAGGGFNPSLNPPDIELSGINGQDKTGDELLEGELDKSEAGLEQYDKEVKVFVEKNNFDVNLLVADRKLQKLEKKYLLADQDMDMAVQWRLGEHSTHSYFLDTVEAIRPTWQCLWDLLMLALAYALFMGALKNMTRKGWMANPHADFT